VVDFMGKKRFIVLALMLLLILPIVSAKILYPDGQTTEEDMSYKIINNTIKEGDWAEFLVYIHNYKAPDDVFKLKVEEEGISWSALTQPAGLLGAELQLMGRQSDAITLRLKPLNLAPNPEKPYVVILDLHSERKKGIAVSKKLPVYILPKNPKPSDFEPDLTVSLRSPRNIDPRSMHSFKVNIINNNPREYDELQVELKGGFFEKTSTIDLGPNASKAVDFSIQLPEDTEPTTDTLTFTVIEDSNVLYRGTSDISIVPYSLPFNKTSDVSDKFLLRLEEITLLNEENVKETREVLIPAPFFKRLVTSTTPDSEVVEVEGEKHFSWMVSLEPGQKEYLTIKTNYRIYLYILILILGGIFLYFMFKNPVTIVKQAEQIRTFQGGIVELKIVINIKNRSAKEFKSVGLIERVPHLIDFIKKDQHGTIPPEKVTKTHLGTKLRWKFNLEPHEERLVTYYLRSKLSILGDVRMPPAVLKVHYGKNRVTIKSNELDISS